MTSDVDRRQKPDRARDSASTVQGIVVALLSLAPLTVAGHYGANLLRGYNSNPLTALSVFWLGLFYAIGLLMALTALAAISRSTRHLARRPVTMVSLGLAAATFDWWTLVGSPTAPVLNLAAVSVVVYVVGELARSHRSGTIPLSLGARVVDWLSGTLLATAPLVFVLPHPARIGGLTEDCSPAWIVVETRCLGATDAWWPLGLGMGVIGGILWLLGRGESFVTGPGHRRFRLSFRRTRRPSTRPRPPVGDRGERGDADEVIDLTEGAPTSPRESADRAGGPAREGGGGFTHLGELQPVPPPRPRARSRPRPRTEGPSR